MAQLTVGKALEMMKALKDRKKQLEELLKETATETSWRDPAPREKTPKYDVVIVDQKLSDINNALFDLASTIKQVNAQTVMDFEVDFKALMSPLTR